MFRWMAVFALCALMAGSMAGQTTRSRGRRGEDGRNAPAGDLLAAEFQGTVTGVSSKDLVIQVAEGNTLEFHITRKTAFFDGKERVKAGAVQQGMRVTVEGKKAPDNLLDAVTVRIVK